MGLAGVLFADDNIRVGNGFIRFAHLTRHCEPVRKLVWQSVSYRLTAMRNAVSIPCKLNWGYCAVRISAL